MTEYAIQIDLITFLGICVLLVALVVSSYLIFKRQYEKMREKKNATIAGLQKQVKELSTFKLNVDREIKRQLERHKTLIELKGKAQEVISKKS